MSESTAWAGLPPVVRRSFDTYLTEYQERVPEAIFQRDGEPRPTDGGFVIGFRDTKTAARYEVDVRDDGLVGETRGV
jgi:hypothetical protein